MSDATVPSTAQLIAGHPTDALEVRRHRQNQIAAEMSGHAAPIPMTSEGLVRLQRIRDGMRDRLEEAKVPLSSRPEGLPGMVAGSVAIEPSETEMGAIRAWLRGVQQQAFEQESQEGDSSEMPGR